MSEGNGNGHHSQPEEKHLAAAPDYRATAGVGRFVGQRVARREDSRLVTGRGQYVDDVVLPGMLHATFLRSNWSCIFGEGCKGVLDADATEMGQGCCSYGAHFVDDDDVQTVVRAVVKLTPDVWQFHKKGRRGGFLAPGDDDDTVPQRPRDDRR